MATSSGSSYPVCLDCVCVREWLDLPSPPPHLTWAKKAQPGEKSGTSPTIGEDFDTIVLCVDRLSNWIVACPTQKIQLTAEKCAHLLLDRGWEPFGIPATVHSDRGPQFVGKWFSTMCARLGIRTSTSQPHRPRANGRAERAGQQLLSVLQKLHLEGAVSWVEALPRALRIFHDTVGLGGLSPYNILFGRDRGFKASPIPPTAFVKTTTIFLKGWQN